MITLERRPVKTSAPVNLAALHGKMNFRSALVAQNGTELRAEHVIGEQRVGGGGVGAERAQNIFFLPSRLESGAWRVAAHKDDASGARRQ